MKIGIWIICLHLSLLMGCATTVGVPQGTGADDQLPMRYELIKASRTMAPFWLDQSPPEKDGVHHLVGLSGNHLDERNAREDAMRHARAQFAKYTGVEISLLDEMIEAVYGKASEILETKITQKNTMTQSTQASVSRIKAQEWYWQKSKAFQGKTYKGDSFKYWVLVSVPVDEYDRVQQWKKEHQEQHVTHLQAEKKKIVKQVATLRRQNQETLRKIDSLVDDGNLMGVVSLIGIEEERLSDAFVSIASTTGGGEEYLRLVEQLNRRLNAKVKSIASSLSIDTGQLGFVCCLLGEQEVVIPVWVKMENSTTQGFKSVKNFPLVLRDSEGKNLGRARTDEKGRAEFRLSGLKSGAYYVSINAGQNNAGVIEQSVLGVLSNVENFLRINTVEADMQGAVKAAISRLFARPSSSSPGTRKVFVGPVTYKGTDQGGDFAYLVKQQISEQLTRIPGLRVISPKKRSVEAIVNAVRTRGIGMEKNVRLGAAATQAVIDGADTFFETSYSVLGNQVHLYMNLREADTDRLLGAAATRIDWNRLPVGVDPVPSQVESLPVVTANDFRAIDLQVSSHMGDGQTYREGETISYFVNIDRDAYLLMIYEDAAGNLIQILPNRYSGDAYFPAGSYLEVPGVADGFKFVIEEPFGVERVWAFASTAKFPNLRGTDIDNGLKVLSGSLPMIMQRLRQCGRSPGVIYGEAQTLITTVARMNLASHQ